jgi:hypothetical protein
MLNDAPNNLYYAAAQELANSPDPMFSLNNRITIRPTADHSGGVVTVSEVLVWALSAAGQSRLEANPNVLNGLLEFAGRKR